MRSDNLLTRRSTYSHWMHEQVRWSDTDLVGHVNNLSFSTYCETGRTHFLHHIIAREADPRAMFFLAQMNVSFIGEVNWPATIDIGTGVLAIGRTSCSLGHGLFEGERCVGSAESVLVSINEADRKPRVIPDWVRGYFSDFSIALQP